MCEEVGVVRVNTINDQGAWVVLAQLLAPELYEERGKEYISGMKHLATHLGLIYECIQDGLRVMQDGDAVKVNSARFCKLNQNRGMLGLLYRLYRGRN